MPDNKWVADLKTVLQVTKARLDVREKKKTEQVAKERYTIADYVRNNKVPRARIGKRHHSVFDRSTISRGFYS